MIWRAMIFALLTMFEYSNIANIRRKNSYPIPDAVDHDFFIIVFGKRNPQILTERLKDFYDGLVTR